MSRLEAGEKPVVRTYTLPKAVQELDIYFVAHGDNGPASRWATHAQAGDFLAFRGTGLPKPTHFEAEWYLLAADPSALPMLAASLEVMPDDAKGTAIIEITRDEDKLPIEASDSAAIHWLVHADPHTPSGQQEAFIRSLDWPNGRVPVSPARQA